MHFGNEWKKFERVIAAIEAASSQGAEVTWDQKINGRQFDVAIRFSFGPHSYLVLIECKNFSSAVPVEKVEAFVTKASDANADKAVLVSKSGFQSGCLEVARKHNIDLFTLVTRDPPALKPRPGIAISELKIRSPAGKILYAFSTKPSILQYEASFTDVVPAKDGEPVSLSVLIGEAIRKWHGDSSPPPADAIIRFPEQEVILFSGKRIDHASCLTFTYRVEHRLPNDEESKAQMLAQTMYSLYDEIKQQVSTSIAALDLPIGFDTKLEPGQLYTNILEKPYMCEWVKEDRAQLALLESYVNLQLIQATFTIRISNQNHFVPITSPVEIVRLKRVYERLLVSISKDDTNSRNNGSVS